MKELVYSFAQLAAIIMILVTLAVSTAAVAQWTDTGATSALETQSMLASDAGS